MKESKEIRILEINENTILGQESVFGWKMVSKEKIPNVVFFKANKYKLERECDDINQENIQIEEQWNSIFTKWAYDFIFKKFKWLIISFFVSLILLIPIFIMAWISSNGDLSIGLMITNIVFLFLFLVYDLFVIVYSLIQINRINTLYKISRRIRNSNTVNLNESHNKANKLDIQIKDCNLNENEISDFKGKILNALSELNLYKLLNEERVELDNKIYLNRNEAILCINTSITKKFIEGYLKINQPIGDKIYIDNIESLPREGDITLVPISYNSHFLIIDWELTYSVNGILSVYNTRIKLPIRFITL